MDGAAAILPVVNRLYAAAAASAPWGDALQSLVEVMGASHAILAAGGAENSFVAAAQVEQHHLRRLFAPETYQLAQPYIQSTGYGATVTITAITSLREWERSAFYNEVIRPMNGYFGVVSGRMQFPTDPFTLSVCRHQAGGDYSAENLATLKTLLPHVAIAVELHLRLHGSERRSAHLTSLLDRLDSGVILVDAAARPVFANARAQQIACESDGLLLQDDALAGATPAATQRLRDTVTACGQNETTRRRIWLERPSQRPPLLLSLLPLSRLGPTIPGSHAPRIAIFITEPDVPVIVNRHALADVYRLTRRECEVVMLLADGLSVDAVAARLGVGRGTVRTHLARLFDKTGARSQTALIALVRGFAEVCR
jgi:DNA-binding CsgD family transcriptional regulator